MALGVVFSLLLTGCGPEFKRKFIRKRKDVRPPQAILVLQPDMKAVLPAADRYREHYAMWKAWHTELLISYGQIRKRDLAYLTGTIGELRAMQQILSGAPSEEMRKILADLSELEGRWRAAPNPWNPSVTARGRLEQLQRRIQKEFHYSKVREHIVEKQDASIQNGERSQEPGVRDQE